MAMTRPNVSQVSQAAAAGANSTITSLSALASINGGHLAGFRNVIYNGQMEIAQRGINQNLTSTYAWGCVDRWAFKQAGASGQGFASKTSGWLDPHGLRNNLALSRNISSTSTGTLSMGQALELPATTHFRSKQVTLSFWAKRGATFSAANNYLYAKITQGHSGYESIVNIGAWSTQTVLFDTPVALTATMVQYQITATVESISAQLGIEFYWTGTGTAAGTDYVEISGVQLELGAVATPFEQRPESLELLICQAYLPAAVTYAGDAVPHPLAMGQCFSTTQAYIMVPFQVQPRTVPSGIILSPLDFTLRIATGGTVAVSALTFSGAGNNSAILTATVASGLVAGNSTGLSNGGTGNIFFTGCEL